jgi:hypothetical protein
MTPVIVTWRIYESSGAHKAGSAAGLQSPQAPRNRNLKNTDFVDIMISEVLRDLPFSQNHPLKSADDCILEFWKINQ